MINGKRYCWRYYNFTEATTSLSSSIALECDVSDIMKIIPDRFKIETQIGKNNYDCE